jgi:hypothetical protein
VFSSVGRKLPGRPRFEIGVVCRDDDLQERPDQFLVVESALAAWIVRTGQENHVHVVGGQLAGHKAAVDQQAANSCRPGRLDELRQLPDLRFPLFGTAPKTGDELGNGAGVDSRRQVADVVERGQHRPPRAVSSNPCCLL